MAALYYYTARDPSGAFVRGSVQAASESAALKGLRTRALFVTSLSPSTTLQGAAGAALQIGSVAREHMVTAFRALATLVKAGVPLRRSLDVAMEQCGDRRLYEALAAVSADVENGLSLSDAMTGHPREFPRLFVAMIRAGELGGVLDEVLERLATLLERDRALQKRVLSALAYPAAVSCASVALVAFLLVSIVPMFRAMYEQMHVALPPITRALIAIGTALRSPAVWLAAGTLASAAFVSVARVRSSDAGRIALEASLLRVPVLGTLQRKATSARIARMLGTLLRSGVAVTAAIDVLVDVIHSGPYRRSLDALQRALAEGSSISEPLLQSGVYEPMFVQLARVGEETGALDAMLLRIADYYDLDVEAALLALSSLLEPAMIVILGGAVGFIVSAIFIPLYTLIGNLK